MKYPDLVVFDLDFTLWDCGGTWCDALSPPFHCRNGDVVDSDHHHIRLYDDVLEILDECDRAGIALALASRTQEPGWAEQLVSLLGIADRFAFSEIYPSSKLRHFAQLQKTTEIPCKNMLFFDDEMRNIDEVSKLGVTSCRSEPGSPPTYFPHDRNGQILPTRLSFAADSFSVNDL